MITTFVITTTNNYLAVFNQFKASPSNPVPPRLFLEVEENFLETMTTTIHWLPICSYFLSLSILFFCLSLQVDYQKEFLLLMNFAIFLTCFAISRINFFFISAYTLYLSLHLQERSATILCIPHCFRNIHESWLALLSSKSSAVCSAGRLK